MPEEILGGLNNSTPGTISSSQPIVADASDPTKKLDISVANVASGTTRTIIMPDQDVDLTPDVTFAAAGGTAAGWQVDTTGTLDDFLVEFWPLRGTGALIAGGFVDSGVLGNIPLIQHGAAPNRWALRHPRGGRRGSIDIAGNTSTWPRTAGAFRFDFIPYGTKPFWVSAWVYPRAVSDLILTNSYGVNNQRHWYSVINASSKVQFVVSEDGINWASSPVSVGSVNLNAWNHVLMGWAEGYAFLSLNGETRVDSAVTSVWANSTTHPIEFGNWLLDPPNNALDGHLADCALWVDYAASPTMLRPTATQIADIYNAGAGNAFLRLE